MSYPDPEDGGLDEHRRQLVDNPDCFSFDKDRTCQNWCNKAWKHVRDHTSFEFKRREAMPILGQMADMVWAAQGGRPLFHFVSYTDLPMSWNAPMNGEKNYIVYEIGHLNPRLSGGDDHPNNLSFQSQRCNQGIQSGLNLDEVMTYFENISEVQNRLRNLISLHRTEEWDSLLSQLGLAD